MRNIVITDGVNIVELQNDLVFEIQYETLNKRKTMASGKDKIEIIGYKPVLQIPTGYVKLEDLEKLKSMIFSGEFLTVTYPTVGGYRTALFSIEPPAFKSFKYDDDGVTVWYGVTLVCRAQEAEK